MKILSRFFYPVIALLMISGCSTPGSAPSSITTAFESQDIGRVPDGFSTALTGGGIPVVWAVREDKSAPGGGPVLIQESNDETSYRFPMCIDDRVSLADVSVEVKYKAISGNTDQAGGIVLRYSPENYYIARANALEDNIDLFKTVNGKREKIEEADVKVTPYQWHTLRFTAKGQHLTVTFDGKVVIEADDTTFTKPGKIGVWTKADSVSAFTDLKIESAR